LSIDGGGIRGVIPAYLLRLFEAEAQNLLPDGEKDIGHYFDVFAGTSTGAIIATGLAAGIGVDRTRQLYGSHGQRIFPSRTRSITEWGRRSKWRRPIAYLLAKAANVTTWFRNKLSPAYPVDGLKTVLEETFLTNGNQPRQLTLGDIASRGRHRLLVTSFNATTRRHKVFDSRTPSEHGYTLTDICLASAAAPTYFPAHRMEVEALDMALLDGGIMANNPSALAAASLLRSSTKPQDIVIVSLGTGDYVAPDEPCPRGELGWLAERRIFDVFFDGNAGVTTEVLRAIVPAENIFRFQIQLPEELMDMDCVENVSELERRTSAFWAAPEVRQKFRTALGALTGAALTGIDLNGTWKSRFTWADRETQQRKSTEDTVEITQSGLLVRGRVTDGEYDYSFAGRIEGNDVIGEWKSLKNNLIGPFLLRFDVETSDRLDGYWIGTGAASLYNGTWKLHRLPVE